MPMPSAELDPEYNTSSPSHSFRSLPPKGSSSSSQASPAFLTPSSSTADFDAPYPRSRDFYPPQYPPSPSLSLDHKRRHRLRPAQTPPSRQRFFPVQGSLKFQTHIVRPAAPHFAVDMSRGPSPTRRSRALSPTRDRATRPSSRCESLLRDTLRRDEQGRTIYQRQASRSPGRWSERKSRPRGGSFLAALKAEDSDASDSGEDDHVFHQPSSSKSSHIYFTRSPQLTVNGRTTRGRGFGYAASPSDDGIHYPYGSPSSPTPLPPSILRTRTAPDLPRAKASTVDSEAPTSKSSPRADRYSLPQTEMHSLDASFKEQNGIISPHESMLRAKIEYALQKDHTGENQPQGRRRNHQRSLTQGVTINTRVMKPTQEVEVSPSPQFAHPNMNAIHAADIARVRSTPPARRRNSSRRQSPESPPELLTPPPTPPFDARMAAETCKRMNGYVSFASVEGLGEPPGLDMDGDDGDEGLRRWAKWLRRWPFANSAEQHQAGAGHQLVVGRHRSDSGSGSSN